MNQYITIAQLPSRGDVNIAHRVWAHSNNDAIIRTLMYEELTGKRELASISVVKLSGDIHDIPDDIRRTAETKAYEEKWRSFPAAHTEESSVNVAGPA